MLTSRVQMLSNVQYVTSAKRDEQSALSDPKRANKQSRHGLQGEQQL
jgi:hypothetical protein